MNCTEVWVKRRGPSTACDQASDPSYTQLLLGQKRLNFIVKVLFVLLNACITSQEAFLALQKALFALQETLLASLKAWVALQDAFWNARKALIASQEALLVICDAVMQAHYRVPWMAYRPHANRKAVSSIT
jgi:hypothetical protein